MAIGVSSLLRIHSYTLKPHPDACILLTSDGLHGVVATENILEVLKSEQSFEVKAHSLIDAARKAGGPDNITVALLRAKNTNSAS